MSQCLRCSKPCEATAVFCDDCRSQLRNELRQGSTSPAFDSASVSSTLKAVPGVSLIGQEKTGLQSDLANSSTRPQYIAQVPQTPVTPHPPTLNNYPDITDRAVSRLNEAAQFIADAEPSSRRLPRASRLAPMRDISSDIRRESTALPRFSNMRNGTGTHEKGSTPDSLLSMPDGSPYYDAALSDNNSALPDLWPWDNEVEEKENEDIWANGTDPLISRRVPNRFESALIEEEDIKRAQAEGIPTNHEMSGIRPRRSSRLRLAFMVLAILAAVALIADGVLLSLGFIHPHHPVNTPNGSSEPAIMLSTNVVNVKSGPQPVLMQIVKFEPGTSVLLTHDVQEMVRTTSGSSVVKIGSNGSAKATIIVDSSWGPAFHQVYAEDITTRYTASAQLQVITAAPSKPAHLLLEHNGQPLTTPLDFGAGIVGADTIIPVQLSNSGDGSISWTASSNQPWLLLTPGQGTFSQNQTIEVAVQRTNLKAGPAYLGTLTFSSNVGPSEALGVTMSVSPLPASGPVLALSPAVLSFSTTDGSATAPTLPPVTLNNAGTQPLNWSLAVTYPATGSAQLGATSPWLTTSLSAGSMAAGASQPVTVSVNSSSLLPGAYLAELIVTATNAVDSPQFVAVSLTIQPHCGVVTTAGYLSFTAVQGKTNPSNQALGLSATASCATGQQALPWKAVVSTPSWLSVTPASGQLKGTTSDFLSVGVNATGLGAGTYAGTITIALTLSESTQTVPVQLVVQPPPSPGAPILSASPLNLNFSTTQGQPSPPG